MLCGEGEERKEEKEGWEKAKEGEGRRIEWYGGHKGLS